MIICTVDDTGLEFRSFVQAGKHIGCSAQWLNWCMRNHASKGNPDVFMCLGHVITVLSRKTRLDRGDYARKSYRRNREKILAYRKKWLAEHPDYYKDWRDNNRDRIRGYTKKWHHEHREWYNEYYRTHPRKKQQKDTK